MPGSIAVVQFSQFRISERSDVCHIHGRNGIIDTQEKNRLVRTNFRCLGGNGILALSFQSNFFEDFKLIQIISEL